MVVRLVGEGPLGSGTCAWCHWVDETGLRVEMFRLEDLVIAEHPPLSPSSATTRGSMRVPIYHTVARPFAEVLHLVRRIFGRSDKPTFQRR